ncbi:glycerol-3-phosphate responsive antiterminator [Tenuibacillus multivorans]|uniref:Glycerol uptake operon antiterminator regulatory protein n=1 Tax=Tenuibacillus multivorans TaxID=237069 RepID=A0A1H0BWY5_9BACI|nr:glycerol-3-phosphate responsive antiterminator [Tenuibacillus multivorans]GEL78555.1 glycerol uptake operon antiterminator regulatory protein [Tenuibacillus multivorans]SDN50178.1 glycerol uptake operon antiterminator [Tenuibacillus multivorans]
MSIVDLVDSQIIASIKNYKDIDQAIKKQPNVSFLLTGDLLTMGSYIQKLKDHDMRVFIHLDFIDGVSNSKTSVEYIAKNWNPDGIITTKNNIVRYAKDVGLYTIQRIFLIDENAIKSGVQVIRNNTPDAIEVMPGLMPKIIDRLTYEVKLPIFVGGLISSKEEILDALAVGALGVSASNSSLWELDL